MPMGQKLRSSLCTVHSFGSFSLDTAMLAYATLIYTHTVSTLCLREFLHKKWSEETFFSHPIPEATTNLIIIPARGGAKLLGGSSRGSQAEVDCGVGHKNIHTYPPQQKRMMLNREAPAKTAAQKGAWVVSLGVSHLFQKR